MTPPSILRTSPLPSIILGDFSQSSIILADSSQSILLGDFSQCRVLEGLLLGRVLSRTPPCGQADRLVYFVFLFLIREIVELLQAQCQE